MGWIHVVPLWYIAGNYTVWYQYVVSFYWASATTSSVGYGDIHAYTDLEV